MGISDVVAGGHDPSYRFANLFGMRLKVRNAWPVSQTHNGVCKPLLGNQKFREPRVRAEGGRRPGAGLAKLWQPSEAPAFAHGIANSQSPAAFAK